MKQQVRPRILRLTLALLREFPDREVRAADVLDWYADAGQVPERTWKQDFSKALSELTRQGLALRTARDRYVWYAIRRDAPAQAPHRSPGRKRPRREGCDCGQRWCRNIDARTRSVLKQAL